jgi:hypothetical protein
VEVVFKQFGVNLNFTPVVLDDGKIHIKLAPEVSDLTDFTSAGDPIFTNRKLSTVVDLRDGQSFAVGGLLSSKTTKLQNQVPWLGQVPVVGALFIVLAGRVTPQQVVQVAPMALVFLAVLVLIVRPVSVGLGLLGTNVSRKERTLLAGMAPRGVVAAAVTSIFALGLGQAAQRLSTRAASATGARREALLAQVGELHRLAGQASTMVPLVFVVIVCTVAIYGLGINRLAEKLGLASAKPQGVLFVGVNTWVVDTAKLLVESDIPVLLVARNEATLARAREAGLPTLTANILSEFAVKDMDLAGIGYFIACTPEDEVNATAARQFARVFGRANTYQLHRDRQTIDTGDDRHDTAGHLSARYAFAPELSRAELDQRMTSGMTITRARLSPQFTLADFRQRYGPDTVILFVARTAGTVEVVDRRTKLPTEEGTLVAMVPASVTDQVPAGVELAEIGPVDQRRDGSRSNNRAAASTSQV